MGKRRTIEEMQQIALERGGYCLSLEYVNVHTKLWWQCGKGHVWNAEPNAVKRGGWCPHCCGWYKTIEDMQRLAEARGGKCLSTEYVGCKEKLKFQCEFGHVWWISADNVVQEKWCPYCAGKYQTIKDMQRIATERSGICLSGEYINSSTKLQWMCSQGHVWEATPSHIKNGEWCPHCSHHVKLTIIEMQRIAEQYGGDCLSKIYVNAQTKLQFRCSKGHKWKARPNNIKSQKGWCPYCAGKYQTIKDMQQIALEHGGWCLSFEYFGAYTKLWWQCEKGHIWKAVPHNIKTGYWCPHCNEGKSEKICREVFEVLFNRLFPKTRPAWLINPGTRRRLELDGYCKELGLAFEYNGEQHYNSKNLVFRKKRT